MGIKQKKEDEGWIINFFCFHLDFYECVSKNVVNTMPVERKACCHVANAFLSRLELICSCPGWKCPKCSKKNPVLAKSSGSQWVLILLLKSSNIGSSLLKLIGQVWTCLMLITAHYTNYKIRSKHHQDGSSLVFILVRVHLFYMVRPWDNLTIKWVHVCTFMYNIGTLCSQLKVSLLSADFPKIYQA